MSIKSTPLSLVLQTLNQKSHLINFIDTPGHVNFSDEMTASLRLSDGALVIVDVVEGVMLNTERALRHAVQSGVPIAVVLNKMDRLVTELKLPPADAYHKLCNVLEQVSPWLLPAAHISLHLTHALSDGCSDQRGAEQGRLRQADLARAGQRCLCELDSRLVLHPRELRQNLRRLPRCALLALPSVR